MEGKIRHNDTYITIIGENNRLVDSKIIISLFHLIAKKSTLLHRKNEIIEGFSARVVWKNIFESNRPQK